MEFRFNWESCLLSGCFTAALPASLKACLPHCWSFTQSSWPYTPGCHVFGVKSPKVKHIWKSNCISTNYPQTFLFRVHVAYIVRGVNNVETTGSAGGAQLLYNSMSRHWGAAWVMTAHALQGMLETHCFLTIVLCPLTILNSNATLRIQPCSTITPENNCQVPFMMT